MKTYPIHLLAALVTLISAGAQEAKPPVDRRPPPQPLLKALDGDRDGNLSPEEIADASSALIELDKNDDGQLTRREISPPPKKRKKAAGQAAPPVRKGPPPILAALDLDKDATLSAEEIAEAPESLAALDKNEDGTLSRKELNRSKPPIKPGA